MNYCFISSRFDERRNEQNLFEKKVSKMFPEKKVKFHFARTKYLLIEKNSHNSPIFIQLYIFFVCNSSLHATRLINRINN